MSAGSTDAGVRDLLEARARRLAEPLPEPVEVVDPSALLVFARSGTSYAVDAASVIEVVQVDELTSIPSVHAAVRGVLNHRGRIVAAVDLARVLGGEAVHAGEAVFAIVVSAGLARFALTADAVRGVTTLGGEEIRPSGGDEDDAPVRGVSRDLVVVIDVAALARDRRVEVDVEVE